NILLDAKGRVYLIDFGAVRDKMLYDERKTLGEGSTIIGTYGYMPYEQFKGQAVPASDLYSLGATLVYLLSHQEPADLKKSAMRLIFEPYINVSPAFSRLLKKLLEPNWRKRYQSARQLKEHLDGLRRGKVPFALRWFRHLLRIAAVSAGLAGLCGLYMLAGEKALDYFTGKKAVNDSLQTQMPIPLNPVIPLDPDLADIKPISLEPWIAPLAVTKKEVFSVPASPLAGKLAARARQLLAGGKTEEKRAASAFAVAAWRSADNAESRDVLLQAVQGASTEPRHVQLMQELSGHDDRINSLAFSPNGKILVSAGRDKTVRVWDMTNPHPRKTLNTSQSEIISLAFSPDGTRFAGGARDGTVILWDAAAYDILGKSVIGHQKQVNDMAFTPDGLRLFTVGGDALVIVWDGKGLHRLRQLHGEHDRYILSLAFTANGALFVTGGNNKDFDYELVFWDAAVQAPIIKFIFRPLSGETAGNFRKLIFTSNGRRLIGVRDDQVFFWDVLERRASSPFKLQASITYKTPEYLKAGALSPDESLFAAADRYGKIILWDMKKQMTIGNPLQGHTSRPGSAESAVRSVIFSPDSKRLISGGADGRIIVWNLKPGFWAQQACLLGGGHLNREEWQKYAGGLPYHENCQARASTRKRKFPYPPDGVTNEVCPQTSFVTPRNATRRGAGYF
ncbi:MAG: hypothetical protein GY862_39560, partial [Gammaproteobacteria bacterium]|nr:hypothetical protein [Gammaproteobacteria bacterium]